MMQTKKSLGQHIESGLSNLGYYIHKTVIDSKDHELQNWKADQKLGYMSDLDKLKLLKRYLYEAATSRANAEYIKCLRIAIDSISEQIENARRYRNSLGYQVSGILNSIILLSILAAFFSFPATWVCNISKSQSQACQVSRVIPMTTFQFFSDSK